MTTANGATNSKAANGQASPEQAAPLRVLIPTFGRPDLLIRTLASLAECALPANYAETVVAENGSDAGARAACAAAAPRLNVRYVRFARGNKSAALNGVLAGVPAGPVVFLDDDVRLAENALTAYAAAAEAHGPGSWFAGPLDVDYEHEPKRWVKPFLPRSAAGWEWDGGEGDPAVIDRMEAMGANWCAFAEDLHAEGAFATDRGPGSETGATGQETDMMTRLHESGKPGRYVPAARVWHYVPRERVGPKWVRNRAYRNGVNLGLQLHGQVWRIPGMQDPPWITLRAAAYEWKTRRKKNSDSKVMRLRVELKTRRIEGIRDGLREALELERNPAAAPTAAPALKLHRPAAGPVPVTVVIPTHGRPDLIVRTLRELAKCDLPVGYRGCVVAENGGKHGVEAFVKTADPRLKVRYLYHERGNKSACLNAAMADVTDGLVVNFDDDVRPGKTVLTDYAAAAEKHGPGCWLAGPTDVDYEAAPPRWLAKRLPKSAVGWNPKHLAGGGKILRPKALGFNWAAWAQDLHAAGGYDPNFGPGSPTGATGQERDMQNKLLNAGKVGRFVPTARVWHWVPAERCSPEWMYHRAYKNGLSSGRRSETKRLTVFGRDPRLELQLTRAKILAFRVARNPAHGERTKFGTRLKVQKLKGFSEGIKQRRAA